jgi:hypothetical protein
MRNPPAFSLLKDVSLLILKGPQMLVIVVVAESLLLLAPLNLPLPQLPPLQKKSLQPLERQAHAGQGEVGVEAGGEGSKDSILFSFHLMYMKKG